MEWNMEWNNYRIRCGMLNLLHIIFWHEKFRIFVCLIFVLSGCVCLYAPKISGL